MAITFLEQRKKQQKLIYILLGLILTVIAVVWWGLFSKTPQAVLRPIATVPKPEKIEINFEVLKNPLLKELLPLPEVKPFEGKAGRENPFLPY